MSIDVVSLMKKHSNCPSQTDPSTTSLPGALACSCCRRAILRGSATPGRLARGDRTRSEMLARPQAETSRSAPSSTTCVPEVRRSRTPVARGHKCRRSRRPGVGGDARPLHDDVRHRRSRCQRSQPGPRRGRRRRSRVTGRERAAEEVLQASRTPTAKRASRSGSWRSTRSARPRVGEGRCRPRRSVLLEGCQATRLSSPGSPTVSSRFRCSPRARIIGAWVAAAAQSAGGRSERPAIWTNVTVDRGSRVPLEDPDRGRLTALVKSLKTSTSIVRMGAAERAATDRTDRVLGRTRTRSARRR